MPIFIQSGTPQADAMAYVTRNDVRALIARKRRSWPFCALAGMAERYLRAYRNERNWSIDINGERAALARISALCQGSILDVGANVGQWAEMARSVAPDRDLHCFEISPSTFQLLTGRLEGMSHVRLNPIGLSDAETTLTLYHYPESPDRTSLVAQPDNFVKEQRQVRVTTGDRYLEDNAIDRVCYLKLDVEGHEMAVLRGFERHLRNRKIAAIQFEHGPGHVMSRHFLGDFVTFFSERGYRVHEIYPESFPPLIYRFDASETFAGRNYLALRSDLLRGPSNAGGAGLVG